MQFHRQLIVAFSFISLMAASGCAVTRGQETVGAFVDDTAITTAVKARLLESREVAGTSISVETMKGTVMLCGFAKSLNEKSAAEVLTRKVEGVTAVKNEIAVRP